MSNIPADTPHSDDFTIHCEYSFENGLQFSLVSSLGEVIKTSNSLKDILLHLSRQVNAMIDFHMSAF